MSYYTIECFRNFVKIGGITQLPDTISKILKQLENSVQPTEQPVATHDQPKRRQAPVQRVEDWTHVRSTYKPTKMPEVKEGTEKTIKDIRIALNKLSNKNEETQTKMIRDLITQMSSDSPNLEDDMKKVVDMIFDVVSSNSFYSLIYANLYKDLSSSFDVFSVKLGDLIENYKKSFDAIVAVDPNTDYDGFCAYTKQNDLRRAMTTFIMNLVKIGVIEDTEYLNIITFLIAKMEEEAKIQTQNAAVEEIGENIFIAVSQRDDKSEEIKEKIVFLSRLRKTDASKYPGMSNRATFKMMDLL
jgi:hypothetical protein